MSSGSRSRCKGKVTNLFTGGMPKIESFFNSSARVVLASGDCLKTLKPLPEGFAKLIITSPPYNLGKVYEKATELKKYLEALNPIVDQLVRVLSPEGSICWQVGNYVENSEIFPLDIFYYPFFKAHGLKLRNRIVMRLKNFQGAMRFSYGSQKVINTPLILIQ